MTGIVLRAAVPGDAPFLTSVTERLGSFPVPPWRTAAEIAAADLRQMIPALHQSGDEWLMLVAERSPSEPLGCLFVTTEQDFFTGRPGAHIEVVAVVPQAEGQGLARRLLEEGEAWARSRGYDHVTLNVFVANTRARAVYEHLGYAAETVRYRKSL
jgi:ribosomal protein S18 acetylase RimI-like enzyme